MDQQATAKSSTIFTSDAVRGSRRRRDGTLQAAKWNATLASKIKAKLINNSSMLKVSLKQNNKALAVALSVEKENSRKLKSEKIFLQKEVEKLQIHNILLHQKLNHLNKTLREIEAFLNGKLLTAIEISSLSESFQSCFPLLAGPRSPTDDQFKRTCQSTRSAEPPGKLPLIATASAKQQEHPSICEVPNSHNCTTVSSEEMNPSSLKYTLSLPSGTTNQKLVEIDPLETSIDKTVSSKENQLCIEVICNSTFLPHDKTTQSLRQSGKLTKQYNNSSLPIHGNVTKRKKLAVLHKSEIQPNIKDFVKKCSSDNLPHYGIDSGISTNDMNLQESSSDLSHIIPLPLKFRNENKIDFKKLLFTDKRKPEETVYYADMDLTASHAGELLTVTVKGKDKLHQNKVSNANSDKILANFRKVKYSKKDKEKMKSMTEVNSNLYTEESHAWADSSKIAETTDLQTQLFQSLTEELPTRNSVEKQSLLDTSKNYETQNCPSKATDSERTSQVNLMSPRKETNTEAFSETFKDMESKTQKPDSNLPVNKMPPEVYRAENLPFQDNSSNVLPLQQDSLYTNEKPKINRKTFHNLSEMNTEKYCGGENEQYGEDASKKSQTEICDRDSKGIQDQNIIKRKYQKKSSYKQSRETESDSINKITPKADQRRSHFSSGRLKHTLAKASRKAYVVPTKNLAQFSLCKDKGLKNKDALHAEAVGVNKITETQQMPAALVTQNGISMNTLQDKEQDDGDDDNTLKKVESSSVAHKPHHISNSDNQEGLSNVEFAALDNHNAVMNFAILNNSEISEDQSKALGAGKAEQKLDVISEDSYKNTLIPCHGRKALQDLTNTGIQSHTFLPKSSKALEGSLAAQSRRKRATICYREPNLRSKLRRGDQFTETQFLDSPVYRVKNKNRFKSKQKII